MPKNKHILHIVGAEIGQNVMIIYHCHLIENTRFLEDLFRQTKADSTLRGGLGTEVAYT